LDPLIKSQLLYQLSYAPTRASFGEDPINGGRVLADHFRAGNSHSGIGFCFVRAPRPASKSATSGA
jgi:hypothetical protein